MLTKDRLKEIVIYDPETGLFTWRFNRSNKKAGEIAGCLSPLGYVLLRLEKKLYKAHRLAWLYVYGEWPNGDIDHINSVKSDNRIANIRDTTRAENKQNMVRAHKDNSCGTLGVTSHRDKFVAQITHEGRRIYIGIYKTIEQAHAAYIAKKREIHPMGML